jgi:hypothetical protein
MDSIQIALDTCGIAFDPCDLVGGALEIARGNYKDGALTIVGAIPVFGEIAKGGKWAKRGVKWIAGELFHPIWHRTGSVLSNSLPRLIR